MLTNANVNASTVVLGRGLLYESFPKVSFILRSWAMPNGYASSPPDPSQSDSRPEVTLWVSMKFMYPLASAGYPVFPGGGILGCRHVSSTSYKCFENNNIPRGPPHGQRRNKEGHTLPSCHVGIPTRLVSSLLPSPARDETHSCIPPFRFAHSDPSVLALL